MSAPRRWLGSREAALLLLIAAAAWSAKLFTIGGLTFTGDRLIGLAAVVAAAVIAARDGLRWTLVHTALTVFTAVQVLTTALAARAWPQGLKFVSVYVLGFACFVVAAEWAADRPGRATRLWIAVGAVLGALGTLIALAANRWQVEIWGSGLSQRMPGGPQGDLGVFAAKVTFDEWNLYSSFLLVAFALALWAWRPSGPGRVAPPVSGFVPLAAITLGLVFGVTRAAWIAMAGLALTWIWAARPALRQVFALAAVAVVGLTLQAVAIGASPLHVRVVKPIRTQSDRNLAVRATVNRATLQSWQARPILGNGAGSINRIEVLIAGTLPGFKPWNGNLVLFVLHDSGLVGLAALVGLVLVIALAARRALRRSGGGQAREVIVPLSAAGVALIWAYQFTHGLWLMYPYVYLGLLTAATDDAAPPSS